MLPSGSAWYQSSSLFVRWSWYADFGGGENLIRNYAQAKRLTILSVTGCDKSLVKKEIHSKESVAILLCVQRSGVMDSKQIIIVLANEMDVDGNLNSESRLRADLAAELFHKQSTQMVITCGWDYRPDSPITIADAFSQYLSDIHNIPQDVILEEKRSRDTVGDAVFTNDFLRGEGLLSSQISVVTSEYHLGRTAEIFLFVFGEDVDISFYGSETETYEDHSDSESNSLISFRSTFAGISSGDFEQIAKRMINSHPFYNGIKHPKFEM